MGFTELVEVASFAALGIMVVGLAMVVTFRRLRK